MNNSQQSPGTDTALYSEDLFDLSILAEMDDHEYLIEMIDIFLVEAGKELKEMKEAFCAGNNQLVYQKAHKIKSNAGIIQANKLTEILDNIEVAGKKDVGKNELSLLVDKAFDQFRLIEKGLKEYLKINR